MGSRAANRYRVVRTAGAAILAGLLLGACGDDRAPEKPEATGSHVWRGQTDLYFEAREQARDVDASLRAKESALDRARRGE